MCAALERPTRLEALDELYSYVLTARALDLTEDVSIRPGRT